jgi:hypothetical protein
VGQPKNVPRDAHADYDQHDAGRRGLFGKWTV